MKEEIENGKRIGVDKSIIVEKEEKENGWGRYENGKNLFGIKRKGKGGGKKIKKNEVINGKRVKIKDSLRNFESKKDRVEGYDDLIERKKRYRNMREEKGLEEKLKEIGE